MRVLWITIFYFFTSNILFAQENGFDAYKNQQEKEFKEYTQTQDSLFTVFVTGRSIIEAQKIPTIPDPITIVKKTTPKIVKIDEIVTPKEKQQIIAELRFKKIPKAIGVLIQVEGLVLKELSELVIDLNLKRTKSINQILAIKKHIDSNWHYISDPNVGKDTWRSAEATLALKYKNKYTGDCDDFAILMASLARQIGLESRVVSGFTKTGGHAWGEFLITQDILTSPSLSHLDFRIDARGAWFSLDWFIGVDHNIYTNNTKVYVE